MPLETVRWARVDSKGRTMRGVVAGLVLVTLAASGAGAQNRVRAALDACFAKYALDLDDGRSDARSIASAVNISCQNDRQKIYSDGGASPDMVQRITRDYREQQIDEATVVVLMTRAKVRVKQ